MRRQEVEQRKRRERKEKEKREKKEKKEKQKFCCLLLGASMQLRPFYQQHRCVIITPIDWLHFPVRISFRLAASLPRGRERRPRRRVAGCWGDRPPLIHLVGGAPASSTSDDCALERHSATPGLTVDCGEATAPTCPPTRLAAHPQRRRLQQRTFSAFSSPMRRSSQSSTGAARSVSHALGAAPSHATAAAAAAAPSCAAAAAPSSSGPAAPAAAAASNSRRSSSKAAAAGNASAGGHSSVAASGVTGAPKPVVLPRSDWKLTEEVRGRLGECMQYSETPFLWSANRGRMAGPMRWRGTTLTVKTQLQPLLTSCCCAFRWLLVCAQAVRHWQRH